MAEHRNKRKAPPRPGYERTFSRCQREIIEGALARGSIETDKEAELMGRAADYLPAAVPIHKRYMAQEAAKIRRANNEATRRGGKLTDDKVAAIRARLAMGVKQHIIAKEEGVSQMTVSFINQGKRTTRDKELAGTLTRVEPLEPLPED